MPPRTPRSTPLRFASLIVTGATLIITACGGAPTSTGAPSTTVGASASGAAPAGASASGTSASATPGAAGTPAAAPTPEPLASTAALATAALPKAKFTTGAASVTLPIEVPPEREYGIGLSGRRTLEGRGMLFAFPEGATVGFWMKGTHIDLDIAFVDASMRVVDVQTMRADTLDIHQPPAKYVAAVEAPAGWYAANGVKAGAQVALDVELRAATGR